MLRLILELHNYNIKLRLRNYNTKLRLYNCYMTLVLQLFFLLDVSFVKYIVIFINSLIKNFLI